MDRKKELKEQYKQMKPPMGVFLIRSMFSNKCYIGSAQNLRSAINGARFKLEAGAYPNRELQKAWKEFGGENFKIEILEQLEYDKDDSKTDYTEDLALLQIIWQEKLSQENIEFYIK